MKSKQVLETWQSLKKKLTKPPTAQKQTQTTLTAEQISQMERELEAKREELGKLVQEQKGQSEEYRKKEQEVVELQTRYDMEVRSKEELVEELKLVQKYLSKTLYLGIGTESTAEQEVIKKWEEDKKKVSRLLNRFTPLKIHVTINTDLDIDLSFLSSNWKAWYYFDIFYWSCWHHKSKVKVKIAKNRNYLDKKSSISSDADYYQNRFYCISWKPNMRVEEERKVVGDLCEIEYKVKKV